MLNKCFLIGRLGNDPESGEFIGHKLAKFSIAVSKTIKDIPETTWFECNAWGKTAEICTAYLTKGSLVHIEGEIQVKMYEKDGEKKRYTSILVSRVTMLGSKNEEKKEEKKEESDSSDDWQDIPF